MTMHKWLGPAAIAAALALGAAPASAQHSRGQRGGGESRGQASQRGGGESPGRAEQARPAQRGPEGPRAVPRGSYEGQRAVPRQSAPYGYNRPYDNRSYGGRSYNYGRPYYGRPYYGGGYSRYGYGYRGYYGHGYLVPVVPYYRPYYAFRPRFTIGFGLFVGYPIPYPYYYGYPSYVYGAPYPYPADPYGYNGYPQTAPYGGTVVPQQGTYGGISFEITPDDAAIYVDGSYVGVVRDFSPTHQPLTVTPGAHHIELQAQGSQPMGFDVNVAAGQVIPYRGALQVY